MASVIDNEKAEWPDGTGMVYLAMSPWDGMWKNRHQLMSRFARQMPVLYVEPWKRLRRLRRQWVGQRKNPFRQVNTTVQHVEQGLNLFRSPANLAVSGSPLIGDFTKRRWLRAVRSAAGEIGITQPILWLSLPDMQFAVGHFGESLSIYHIVDEYGGYTGQTGNRRKSLWRAEQAMLDSVDLTIVVSPELEEAKRGKGRSIVTVENAVDFQLFDHAAKENVLPAAYDEIPGPRLGYCGLIGARLDLTLLVRLAQELPGCSIVLVGLVDSRGCEDSIQSLQRLDNVYFLGQQAAHEVPQYVAGFDVGLLPYESNLETSHISPLKMYEYFAAGKPVVSTDIPAARRHREYLSVCADSDRFVTACSELVQQEASTSRSDVLKAFAARNTWDDRVVEIELQLQSRLQGADI